MSGDIMVAICTLGKVRAEWALQFRGATNATGRTHHFVTVQGYPTSHARNVACTVAMERAMEYVFFWDDDVIPQGQGHFQRLVNGMAIEEDATAISGVYPRRGDYPEPIAVKEEGGGTFWGWRDGGLHQVYMAGTGFMCLRVADLGHLDVETYEVDDKWFRMFFNTDERTDDFWFGDLLARNKKEWYVDGEVVCDQMDIEGNLFSIEEAKVAVG